MIDGNFDLLRGEIDLKDKDKNSCYYADCFPVYFTSKKRPKKGAVVFYATTTTTTYYKQTFAYDPKDKIEIF